MGVTRLWPAHPVCRSLTGMGQAQGPEAQVGRGVGDAAQAELDGVDGLMHEHLGKNKLGGREGGSEGQAPSVVSSTSPTPTPGSGRHPTHLGLLLVLREPRLLFVRAPASHGRIGRVQQPGLVLILEVRGEQAASAGPSPRWAPHCP